MGGTTYWKVWYQNQIYIQIILCIFVQIHKSKTFWLIDTFTNWRWWDCSLFGIWCIWCTVKLRRRRFFQHWLIEKVCHRDCFCAYICINLNVFVFSRIYFLFPEYISIFLNRFECLFTFSQFAPNNTGEGCSIVQQWLIKKRCESLPKIPFLASHKIP